MPIFAVNNIKILLSNEEKTKSAIVEYPREIGLADLLKLVEELKDAILKGIEQENAKKEEPKTEQPPIEAEVLPKT